MACVIRMATCRRRNKLQGSATIAAAAIPFPAVTALTWIAGMVSAIRLERYRSSISRHVNDITATAIIGGRRGANIIIRTESSALRQHPRQIPVKWLVCGRPRRAGDLRG